MKAEPAATSNAAATSAAATAVRTDYEPQGCEPEAHNLPRAHNLRQGSPQAEVWAGGAVPDGVRTFRSGYEETWQTAPFAMSPEPHLPNRQNPEPRVQEFEGWCGEAGAHEWSGPAGGLARGEPRLGYGPQGYEPEAHHVYEPDAHNLPQGSTQAAGAQRAAGLASNGGSDEKGGGLVFNTPGRVLDTHGRVLDTPRGEEECVICFEGGATHAVSPSTPNPEAQTLCPKP